MRQLLDAKYCLYCIYLPLADVYVPELALLQDFQTHIPLPHVEQFLTLLQMEILALVGTAHVKHLKITLNIIVL